MSNSQDVDDIRPAEVRPSESRPSDLLRKNSTLLMNQFKKMVTIKNLNADADNNNNNENDKTSWFDKLRLRTNEAPKRPQLQVFPKQCELIDTTALNQFDELMIECESYLAAIERNTSLMNAPIDNTSVLNRFRNALSKPKFEYIDPDLFQNLLDRIFESEDTLTSMVEEAMPTRLSLALQAQHLNIRLESCIKFNGKSLQLSKQNVENVLHYAKVINNLLDEVNCSISFLDAISHQSENEESPYVPWALREQSKNNFKEEPKVDDSVEYRQSLVNRKKSLKQVNYNIK
jgi:hypothetical protein